MTPQHHMGLFLVDYKFEDMLQKLLDPCQAYSRGYV